jgi:hypothetical protein
MRTGRQRYRSFSGRGEAAFSASLKEIFLPCIPPPIGSARVIRFANLKPPKGDHFAPVRINDTLTLLFDDFEEFESHHYAFHVSDAEFDAIFGRIREAKLAYGSTMRKAGSRRIQRRLVTASARADRLSFPGRCGDGDRA